MYIYILLHFIFIPILNIFKPMFVPCVDMLEDENKNNLKIKKMFP